MKKLRIAGVDTLVLRGAEGNLQVPREWTDRADPDPYLACGVSPRRFDVDQLLELADWLEQLAHGAQRHQKSYPKEIDR